MYNPGKSVSLVGYLLFYLCTMGVRVILQMESPIGGLGFVFDGDSVREISTHNAKTYNDGKPCYLLVSADGPFTCPSPDLGFCSNIIVVTSPNLKSNSGL